MKRKDLEDLKTKSISELKKKIIDLEKEKVNVNLELKMGKVKNVHQPISKRKEIAQIKTILTQKLLMSRRDTKNAAS